MPPLHKTILSLLPATLPELRVKTGLATGRLTWILFDMASNDTVHRTGTRRRYVYHPGPDPSPAPADHTASLQNIFATWTRPTTSQQ